jgi:hypothetical protein
VTDRAAWIEDLADFAGPLGPFERAEDKEHRREAWLAGLDAGAVDALLSLLTERPAPQEAGNVPWEDLEWTLVTALVAAGSHDPQGMLERIGPLLVFAPARPAVIDVIGELGLQDGIRWLEPIVESGEPLTTDELARLACTLGEIGGTAARRLLERLRGLPGADDPEVRQEIEIALRGMGEP